MMYNTMYGGIGAVGGVPAHGPNTTQNAQAPPAAKANGNPIHIKIEDQTGVPSQPGSVANGTNKNQTNIPALKNGVNAPQNNNQSMQMKK
jgi:hypothetical protein